MLRKFISKVFGGGKSGASTTKADAKPAHSAKAPAKSRKRGPAVLQRDEHGIRREQLSRGAIGTCEGLQKAGYQAYVVGGAVRDLLHGIAPKDFDVATDATPEQVHAAFRRSRIIGRRFRIVHVMFGAEQVEVSTFRTADLTDAETDAHGRVLRDNTFGSMADDATRHPLIRGGKHGENQPETRSDMPICSAAFIRQPIVTAAWVGQCCNRSAAASVMGTWVPPSRSQAMAAVATSEQVNQVRHFLARYRVRQTLADGRSPVPVCARRRHGGEIQPTDRARMIQLRSSAWNGPRTRNVQSTGTSVTANTVAPTIAKVLVQARG